MDSKFVVEVLHNLPELNGEVQLFNGSEKKIAKGILRFLYQKSNYKGLNVYTRDQCDRFIKNILSQFPLKDQDSIINKTSKKQRYTRKKNLKSKKIKSHASDQDSMIGEISRKRKYTKKSISKNKQIKLFAPELTEDEKMFLFGSEYEEPLNSLDGTANLKCDTNMTHEIFVKHEDNFTTSPNLIPQVTHDVAMKQEDNFIASPRNDIDFSNLENEDFFVQPSTSTQHQSISNYWGEDTSSQDLDERTSTNIHKFPVEDIPSIEVVVR